MFEKEAEEYARRNNPAEYGVRATHFTVLNSFKDGAEFGYNKCKEEINQKGLALQSDMDETIRQNIALKKELEKTNEWHRVDEGKYPNKEQLGKSFIVAFAFNERTQEYYSFDCAEYVDKERFLAHTTDASGENNAYKIIAWKEIE